jgi:hypothetical protein
MLDRVPSRLSVKCHVVKRSSSRSTVILTKEKKKLSKRCCIAFTVTCTIYPTANRLAVVSSPFDNVHHVYVYYSSSMPEHHSSVSIVACTYFEQTRLVHASLSGVGPHYCRRMTLNDTQVIRPQYNRSASHQEEIQQIPLQGHSTIFCLSFYQAVIMTHLKYG